MVSIQSESSPSLLMDHNRTNMNLGIEVQTIKLISIGKTQVVSDKHRNRHLSSVVPLMVLISKYFLPFPTSPQKYAVEHLSP